MESFEKILPHLTELRKRLLFCAVVYLIILTPLLFFSTELYTFIAQPILKNLPHGGALIATQVITPFTTPLKLSLVISLIITIPFMLYHIWAFVAPGLYSHEKRPVRLILIYSTFLFYTGLLFAHTLVLPMVLGFFMQIAPKGITIMTDMTHYLDFVLAIYLAFGLAFQVPIITFILIQTGIISIQSLEKNRPYIVVAAFFIGMILTPPDVLSQILLAIPLLILFEGGLLLAKWQRKTTKSIEPSRRSPESMHQ